VGTIYTAQQARVTGGSLYKVLAKPNTAKKKNKSKNNEMDFYKKI
jgi:hypothetical protein